MTAEALFNSATDPTGKGLHLRNFTAKGVYVLLYQRGDTYETQYDRLNAYGNAGFTSWVTRYGDDLITVGVALALVAIMVFFAKPLLKALGVPRMIITCFFMLLCVLAVIYDLSSLTFQMNIDELDISQVSTGQEVQVTADAFENEVFSGTVTNVSMEGTSSNGVTYYPVTVTLNELGNLLPGMNVDGVIVVDSAEQALAVPADALQRGNVVYVKDDSVTEAQGRVPAGFREVQVETGVINSDYVEIVSGDLQEGDQVYVSESSVSSTNSMMPMGGGNMGGMGGAMGGGNRQGGSSGGGPGGAGPGGSGRR